MDDCVINLVRLDSSIDAANSRDGDGGRDGRDWGLW